MKRRLKDFGILMAILAVIGTVVLVSGIVPIKASSKHWAITKWVLDFASDRSIDTHSSGIVAPPLNEPGMVTLGAATYESNCRWCHGAPGMPKPVVAQQMTPTPPSLLYAADKYESAELFYIIKHGIKFAGMPAWPALQRDDEIWPVVAFLIALGEMDEQTYLQLVHPEPETDSEAAQSVAQLCAACHDSEGSNRAGPRVPILAGQSEDYLRATMQAFRAGKRHSGVMQPIAARLRDEKISEIATYFTYQELSRADQGSPISTNGESVEAGRELVMHGDPAHKIPSCVDCHGPGSNVRSSEYPKLAGQSAQYIRRQLKLFQMRARGGTSQANLMHPIADKLTPSQMKAVAYYYEQASDFSGDE